MEITVISNVEFLVVLTNTFKWRPLNFKDSWNFNNSKDQNFEKFRDYKVLKDPKKLQNLDEL